MQPGRIVSDNSTAFMAASVHDFICSKGVDLKAVLAYAPMANRRAEKLVGTTKNAIKKLVVKNGEE